jgi:hypothetical protein
MFPGWVISTGGVFAPVMSTSQEERNGYDYQYSSQYVYQSVHFNDTPYLGFGL